MSTPSTPENDPVRVIMKRDRLCYEDAAEEVRLAYEECSAVVHRGLDAVEETWMSHTGLEPDYIDFERLM